MTDIDFSEVGPAYTWRFPYFPKFFERIAIAAELDDNSFVLDLAFGTGELAVGISPYCGEVLGIDKSQEMLSLRRELPANVRFLQADLRPESISIPRPDSLVTIGRAIPYLDRSVVMPFLESALGEQGSVLVCAAGMSNAVPWRPHTGLCAPVTGSARRRRDSLVESSSPIHDGRKYRPLKSGARIVAAPRASSATHYPIRTWRKGSSRTKSRFLLELRQILAPYQDAAGVITLGGISWGVEYRCHE